MLALCGPPRHSQVMLTLRGLLKLWWWWLHWLELHPGRQGCGGGAGSNRPRCIDNVLKRKLQTIAKVRTFTVAKVEATQALQAEVIHKLQFSKACGCNGSAR
jgi:hypothetical protein